MAFHQSPTPQLVMSRQQRLSHTNTSPSKVTNTDAQLHKYQLGAEIPNCPAITGGQVENGRFIDLLIRAIARTEIFRGANENVLSVKKYMG